MPPVAALVTGWLFRLNLPTFSLLCVISCLCRFPSRATSCTVVTGVILAIAFVADENRDLVVHQIFAPDIPSRPQLGYRASHESSTERASERERVRESEREDERARERTRESKREGKREREDERARERVGIVAKYDGTGREAGREAVSRQPC